MSYTEQKSININPNKQKKYKEKLEKLLDKHRVDSGTNTAITHVSLGTFRGKYAFDNKSRKKLMRLIKESNKHDVNLSIAEKPKEYGPIKVDLDIEIPKEHTLPGRLYDNDLVMKTVELYRNAIKKYLDINDSELQACILEKESPTDKGLVLKDGIHILFPYICCHYKIRHLIRNHVVDKAAATQIFDKYSNSIARFNSWL